MVKHKDDYQVEGIVGWTLVHDCPNESPVLSRNYVQGLPANARVSLLKYHTTWVGYPNETTLEPRAHFNHWLPLYDRQIAQVLRDSPEWGDPALLEGQAGDINYDKLSAWQSQLAGVKEEKGREILGGLQFGLVGGGEGPGAMDAGQRGLMQPPPVKKHRSHHRKRPRPAPTPPVDVKPGQLGRMTRNSMNNDSFDVGRYISDMKSAPQAVKNLVLHWSDPRLALKRRKATLLSAKQEEGSDEGGSPYGGAVESVGTPGESEMSYEANLGSRDSSRAPGESRDLAWDLWGEGNPRQRGPDDGLDNDGDTDSFLMVSEVRGGIDGMDLYRRDTRDSSASSTVVPAFAKSNVPLSPGSHISSCPDRPPSTSALRSHIPIVLDPSSSDSDSDDMIILSSTAPPPTRLLPGVSPESRLPQPPVRVAPPLDPYNQGFIRPTTTQGVIKLDNAWLKLHVKNNLLKSKHLSSITFAKDLSTLEMLYQAWDIGNVVDNYFDFKGVMSRGPAGPRMSWVYAPSKNIAKGATVLHDYRALQYILSDIPGVQEVGDLRRDVKAVFVHISEMEHIGAGPLGKLAALDHFRSGADDDTMFIIFGTKPSASGHAKDCESVFLSFWTVAAAITFTTQSYIESPWFVAELLRKSSESRRHRLGRRDIFPWAPSLYHALGGPFHLPPDSDESYHAALNVAGTGPGIRTFHRSAAAKHLKLVGPAPYALPGPRVVCFPHGSDEYPLTAKSNEFLVSAIAEMKDPTLVSQFMECTTVARLEARSATFSKRYLQIRRWIVVGTDAEVAALPHSSRIPGIDRMTLAQASTFVNTPRAA